MQIYALLVGINAYPDFPLSQCVDDAEKMENYLRGAADEADTELHIKKLTDTGATKENVASAIHVFLGQPKDDDVALFYFSGHGAYEDAMGRFPDEPDGLLECLVCFHNYDEESGYLLADKELRHLLGQLPAHPHLVTVFDCCHSGDMVRAAPDGESRERIKRLAGHFPARPYEAFLFAGEISSADLKSKPLAASLPFKNHVHIAACTSSQSSWEDAKGGVFT